VTRPRAADDFTTIHARLEELRRERELAAKQDARGDDDPRDASNAVENRQRLMTVAAGRRYGTGRLR
jgi:hypothetical protein